MVQSPPALPSAGLAGVDAFRESLSLSRHHSTYSDTLFVNCVEGWKEKNILINDALNTFYLRLYVVRPYR